jgi:hypothetical protein
LTRDGPNAACALCSLSDGVDAAHVLRWKTASDECRAAGLCTTWQPQNGILLCRRCHTYFDALLWSVDPDGRVNVADALLQYDRADPRYAALNGSTFTLCTHPSDNHPSQKVYAAHHARFLAARAERRNLRTSLPHACASCGERYHREKACRVHEAACTAGAIAPSNLVTPHPQRRLRE